MDNMRESFEKWAKAECLDLDSVDGFYSDNDTHIAWGAWQAAQSAAVPVVGEVVGYLAGGTLMRRKIQGYDCKPLIIKPTTSISADELAKIRAYIADGIESEGVTEHDHSIEARKLVKLIDAAIAAEGEKK